MIFNYSFGGISYINVTAPAGAITTATCSGLTITISGSDVIEAPIIGTWSLSCVYDSLTRTDSVNVTTFGVNYNVTFTYTAFIAVSTFPGASVSATKTGQTTLTGTADSSGACTLTVPAGGLGTWDVTATNGSVSESGSVNVAAYDQTYNISLISAVPDITIKIGDNTYRYQGVEISQTGIKISPVGVSGWKFWMTASGTVTFNYLPTNIDICLVGPGGNGGSHWGSYEYGYGGGGGGGGGAVNRLLGQTLSVGVEYAVTIDATSSVFSDIVTSVKGEGGGSGGGRSGGNSGNGSSGQWVNDHTYPPSSGGGGSGGGGVYAFTSDTTPADFDGVKYANGGGGGTHSGGGGTVYSSRGSGGAGGGSGNAGRTNGIDGILIMRNVA